MIFLSIFIRKYRKFYNSPFLTIHELALMIFVNVLRYLSFIYFDAKIRDSESAHTFHQVYVDDETCEQSKFLTRSQTVFYLCLLLRYDHIKEVCQLSTVDISIRIDKPL